MTLVTQHHQQTSSSLEQEPEWLTSFVKIYQQLSVDNLPLLEELYHKDIVFIDPMHKLKGIAKLTDYFQALYTNLFSCKFVITNVIYNNNQAAIYWQMTYVHPKLNGGNAVSVIGSSHIKGSQDKVTFHQDYIDLGAMLYEQLPIVGRLIKWIKTKAARS